MRRVLVVAVRIAAVCSAGTRCPEPESFGSYSALAAARRLRAALPLSSTLFYSYMWTRDAEQSGADSGARDARSIRRPPPDR